MCKNGKLDKKTTQQIEMHQTDVYFYLQVMLMCCRLCMVVYFCASGVQYFCCFNRSQAEPCPFVLWDPCDTWACHQRLLSKFIKLKFTKCMDMYISLRESQWPWNNSPFWLHPSTSLSMWGSTQKAWFIKINLLVDAWNIPQCKVVCAGFKITVSFSFLRLQNSL